MSWKTRAVMPLHMVTKGPFTIEDTSSGPAGPNETLPRRHPDARNGLLTHPAEGVNTLFDIITRSAELYPDRPAVGSRSLVRVHRETKQIPKVGADGATTMVDKEWTYFELSGYTWLTYTEYKDLVLALGCGLRKLGISRGKRIHFFASTR